MKNNQQPALSLEMIDDLRNRYREPEIPKCSICGGELSVQRAGGGSPTIWACSGMIDDPTGKRSWIYAEGRSTADDHYERSRWTDYRRGGDSDVIDLINAYQALTVQPVRQHYKLDEELSRLATHIASSKEGLPEEWEGWISEIESDLRRYSGKLQSSDSGVAIAVDPAAGPETTAVIQYVVPNLPENIRRILSAEPAESSIHALERWFEVEEWLQSLLSTPQSHQPELAVWYGSMPESNGKSNWTAILYRKDQGMMGGPHLTIDRSEYPDRVRYAADEVRYLIGELVEEPDILAYDTDKHSGYKAPSTLTNEGTIDQHWLSIPSKPSQAHLISIAKRYRHDFPFLDSNQKEGALAVARQMYEECSGQGFYTITTPGMPNAE